MFTSPRSDARVALLWGDRWWLDGRDRPLVFGELSRAAETLLAEFGDARPRALRLIFQPTTLVSAPVSCPQGGRSTLRDALQEEYPAIDRADCAWGYEPLSPGPDGAATLLHYESEPGLIPLLAALSAAGVEVEGAWPLASALNLVPTDWPDTGALTVVAVADGKTFVYRHMPSGCRECESAVGQDAATLASRVAREACARDDTALHVVALDETGQRLALALTEVDEPAGQRADWHRLVKAARMLAMSHPNQLALPSRWLNPRRVVQAATALCLIAASGFAFDAATRHRDELRVAADRTVELASLQGEVARLRETEAQAHQLHGEIERRRPGPAACAELLRVLPRGLPPQIVVTRIRTDERGFALDGGVTSSGLPPEAWQKWQAALRDPSHPWRFADATMPSADFTLKGQWR